MCRRFSDMLGFCPPPGSFQNMWNNNVEQIAKTDNRSPTSRCGCAVTKAVVWLGSLLVLLGGPQRGGGDWVVGELGTGGVTVASPQLFVELSEDILHTGLHLGVVEVAGRESSPDSVDVEVERVETRAVGPHRVEQTESLTLLNKESVIKTIGRIIY